MHNFTRYVVCPGSVYTDIDTTATKANEHSVDWPKNYPPFDPAAGDTAAAAP